MKQNQYRQPLRFRADGSFTILQLADVQQRFIFPPVTRAIIERLYHVSKPDLIILTGDNIANITISRPGMRFALWRLMRVLRKFNVPVAAVPGNHDTEKTRATREDLLRALRRYPFAIGAEEGLSGPAAFRLPVLPSRGDKPAFALYLFDSGDYNHENALGGYACVTREQVEWYERAAEELKVPSLAFQHIIVPEIYDALREVPSDTEGAVEWEGKRYVLPSSAAPSSVLRESPCPPRYSNGQFDAFARHQLLAFVCGHDHVNSFVIPYRGVNIINTPGIGFDSYGDRLRGGRVFTLREDGSYSQRAYAFDELFDQGDAAMQQGYVACSRNEKPMKRLKAYIGYLRARKR